MSEKSIWKELGLSPQASRRELKTQRKTYNMNLPTEKEIKRIRSKSSECKMPKCFRMASGGEKWCYRHWNGAK